ncbi:hypothetical protein OAO18_04445 [Francisellaceae bacterium]|nr:hypothetical protein [Francisellaceae bacterium]
MCSRYILKAPALLLASVVFVTPVSAESLNGESSSTTSAQETSSSADAVGETSKPSEDQLIKSTSEKAPVKDVNKDGDSNTPEDDDGPIITTSYDFNNTASSTADAVGKFLWGFTPSSGIGIGMWSYHVFYDDPFGPDVNWHQDLLAINYEWFYVATIKNTYFERGYTAGIRRNFFRYQDGPINVEIGYNLGLLSGYKDGQGMWLSNYSPVIPFLQGFVDITIYHVGVEFAVIPPLEVLSIAGRISF